MTTAIAQQQPAIPMNRVDNRPVEFGTHHVKLPTAAAQDQMMQDLLKDGVGVSHVAGHIRLARRLTYNGTVCCCQERDHTREGCWIRRRGTQMARRIQPRLQAR